MTSKAEFRSSSYLFFSTSTSFEWSFILDSASPPYERSPYGRVRYVIKASVIGGGRAKSDISTWRDIFPIVNPNPDGGPTPLTVLC